MRTKSFIKFLLIWILALGGIYLLMTIFKREDWRLEAYEIHGIDVSHYQKDINFQALKNDEFVDFVFVKATEGINFKDHKFKHNWQQLKAAQLPRGAYHFYRPSRKAKQQARSFINMVNIEAGDLPPVLDLEETDGRSKETILKGVKIWLTTVEQHYKVKPIIYVNQNFYFNYIKGNFDEYPIWLAVYRWGKPDLEEGEWKFWQYTDRGRISGIRGRVDRNVFYGKRSDFEKLLVKKEDE